MNEKKNNKLDSSYSDLPASGLVINDKKAKNSDKLPKKGWLVFLIVGIVGIVGGITCVLVALLRPKEEKTAMSFPTIPSNTETQAIYSPLTGVPLADTSLVNAPTFCVQTPNGMDGARPQSGLTEAGVVFEAIAEAGITRFAAIYQNPTSAIIGPIRSLRLYYLEWDTPFDCTVVHAGGASDALAALSSGGYRDLTENYSYMYRGTYSRRLWNNLFTTSAYLKQFNNDRGYTTSNVQGFSRLTPEESKKKQVDSLVTEKLNITAPTENNTSELTPKVTSVSLHFGGMPNFNVNYTYDLSSNTYSRWYESGTKHEVYQCTAENLEERNPEDVCELTQVSPSVVIAMIVNEKKASDNYHEDISVIGSGEAYIFQNGTVTKGTWKKPTRADQIKFTDSDANEIKLAPGQTFISAIPTYGSVEY